MWRSFWILVVLVMGGCRGATAASFDCSRSTSVAENLICKDQRLSEQDDELSKIYEGLLKNSFDPQELIKQQRLWLRSKRNACATIDCLGQEYASRIHEMRRAQGMTDGKAVEICEAVVDLLNAGKMQKNIQKFRDVVNDEESLRSTSQMSDIGYIDGVIEVKTDSNLRRFVHAIGGGTCRDIQVVDLAAKTPMLLPSGDSDETLRWASWGGADALVFIGPEPVVVTGNLWFGESTAELVSWIAPDGPKRPLCSLIAAGGERVEVVKNENSDLCNAVLSGEVVPVGWKTDSDNVGLAAGDSGGGTPVVEEVLSVDLDRDGVVDEIGKVLRESSAGCGGTYRWLVKFSHENQKIVQGEVGALLAGVRQPVGDRFDLTIFKFGNKPYILARGEKTSASVISLWGGQPKTWCEYNGFPKHEVRRYFEVGTWPIPD